MTRWSRCRRSGVIAEVAWLEWPKLKKAKSVWVDPKDKTKGKHLEQFDKSKPSKLVFKSPTERQVRIDYFLDWDKFLNIVLDDRPMFNEFQLNRIDFLNAVRDYQFQLSKNISKNVQASYALYICNTYVQDGSLIKSYKIDIERVAPPSMRRIGNCILKTAGKACERGRSYPKEFNGTMFDTLYDLMVHLYMTKVPSWTTVLLQDKYPAIENWQKRMFGRINSLRAVMRDKSKLFYKLRQGSKEQALVGGLKREGVAQANDGTLLGRTSAG